MENMGMEQRLRALELGYARIESQTKSIASDIKDMKETLKELAEIAKKQIQTDAVLDAFRQEINNVTKRVEKNENDISWLKKIAYSAILVATIIAPVVIEFLKRTVLK